jgi:hypothetical protein
MLKRRVASDHVVPQPNVFDEITSAREISNVSMKALPFTFALTLTFTKIASLRVSLKQIWRADRSRNDRPKRLVQQSAGVILTDDTEELSETWIKLLIDWMIDNEK